MNLREHDQRDDMKVWLSQDEVTALLDAADGTEERIALALGARCGLRSHEVLDVAPDHVVDTDAGTMLRVHHGKGDKYRETPVPRSRDDDPHGRRRPRRAVERVARRHHEYPVASAVGHRRRWARRGRRSGVVVSDLPRSPADVGDGAGQRGRRSVARL